MSSEKERLTAYLEPTLLKKIKVHCANRGFTISTFVELLLKKELKETRDEPRNPPEE